MQPSFIILHICIINCTFTNNYALFLFNTYRPALSYGSGGALSMIISVRHLLKLVFSDNRVINNYATVYGGGVYCLIQACSNQNYTFGNNVFMNNVGSAGGGMAFTYHDIPMQSQFAIHNLLNNCTFYHNTGISRVAGAVGIYSFLALIDNSHTTFKHCKFINNTAAAYGGAVDITSYDFFGNIQAVPLIEFTNWLVLLLYCDVVMVENCTSTFDGNTAAMNLMRYGAQLHNVTFENNRQFAMRVSIHDFNFCLLLFNLF